MTIIVNPLIQQQTLAISAKNIGTSILPNGLTDTLMELKYSFAGFVGVGAGISYGDVVVFEATDDVNNPYGCTISRATTGNPAHANKNLMVFVSYQSQSLIVMHKGFIDFEDTTSDSLGSWSAGDNIYINQNKIQITPSQNGGDWVKSIGFCVPNIENKKRVWFESDSTYFTIG